MLFTTWTFGVFLITSLALYWTCPAGWRKYVLILAGCVFYFASLPQYLFLLIGLAVAVYLIGQGIIRVQGEEAGFLTPLRLLVAGLILCSLSLFVFKYLNLVIQTINNYMEYFLPGPALPLLNILIPLGISFFTFEFIHYLVDIYKGRMKPESLSLSNLLTFSLFFPTLLSGPIKRYQQFQDQVQYGVRLDPDGMVEGLRRIIIGFGKKFIVADTASQFTGALASPETAGWWALVIAVYAYSIKIYFDFSGYTDIAVGVSLLFGLRVPENFNRPYFRRNIAEFWRNWHMSLSSWIRDYLYIPLGGSRVSTPRVLFNLMVVMGICGLWHGASWNFLVWGLWHGMGLGLHRLSNIYLGDRTKLPAPIAIVLTFHFVTVGWIFFATPDMAVALAVIQRILFS